MLHHSNPTVPLRLSAQRTVLNCVWAEQLDLSNVPETGPLLDYLRAQSTADAGDVKSHMHLDSSLHTPLETLCRLVAKKLKAWRLLVDNTSLVSSALLMSTRGAQPHHDADVTPEGNKLFWSLSLQDTDTDVVFANIGQRLPQSQGTLVVFDPCQPHAVMAREQKYFMKSHFKKSRSQFFAGGEFVTDAWSEHGVEINLSEQTLDAYVDIRKTLLNQKACMPKV